MIYFQIAERTIFIRPIVSPQATLFSLNGFPLLQYFLLYDQTTLSNSEETPLFLNFKAEVSITGNMLTNSKFSLQKFVSNAFNRLENAKIKLNSKLTFERVLVNSVYVQSLNLTRYMRRTSGELVHNAKQYTQSIYLNGDVILTNTSKNMSKIYHLDDYNNLASILTAIVITDGPKIPCDIISEKIFNASVVSIENIDQIHMIMENYYDMQSVFHNILNADEYKIQSLIVDGDVHFCNSSAKLKLQNTFARILNLFEADNFFNSVVLKSQSNKQKTIEIAGSKTFISEINISFSHINEFNKQIQVRDWFSHSLRQQRTEKRVEQIIQSSGWQFINTISDNFEIKHTVNGIHFAISSNRSDNAMFTYDNQFQTVVIKSDVSFSNDVKITNKFNCNQLRPCEVNNLALNTLHLSQYTWDKLGIIGDVKLLMAELNELSPPVDTFNFLEVALTSNADAIIVTDVIFKTNIGRIILNQVNQASLNHPNIALVNNINLVKIFNDAITNTIQKTKTFCEKQLIAKETVCSGSENVVLDSIIVQLINDVDIRSLDSLLFIGSSYDISILPWQRILFLHDIETQAVYVNKNQTINGISFADVYFTYSETLSQRPTISFDLNNQVRIVADLTIDVKFINGFNWHFFIANGFRLKNRLQLPIDREMHEVFDGFPTFENLILIGDKIKIDQINDAVYDDIFLKNSIEKQQISGNKQMSLLHIKKPSHTWRMNNFEFVSIFTKTISMNHMQLIEKLVIRNPFQLKGISVSVNRTSKSEIH